MNVVMTKMTLFLGHSTNILLESDLKELGNLSF